MNMAYKQLAVCPDQLRYMVIAIWDLTSCTWRFAVSWALHFGLSGAVLHFTRVPAFITALCRRWFAIPVQHFFDDFRIVEPSFTRESGYKWFAKVTEFLGWRFDPDKDQPPCATLPMLGCLEDWSISFSEFFDVHADPERLYAVTKLVTEVIEKKDLPKGLAASLRGKNLHLSGTMPGKTGRGNYPKLSAIADGATHGWSRELEIE